MKASNSQIKVLVTTSTFGEGNSLVIERLRKLGAEVILNPYKKTLNQEQVTELIKRYDPVGMIAGVEPLNQAVLSQAKALKAISRCGIDTTNVDLTAAKKIGIQVFNTPDAPTQAVAELTVGLILNLIRRINEADRAIRNGKWKKLMGRLLSDMTVGIFGCGRIGSRVALCLEGFGCKIIGCDILKKAGQKIKIVPQEELMRCSDIITFHLALTSSTLNLVNREFISLLKPGIFLVNTSRGQIIDEAALVDGLASGQIAAAALDTFQNEPYNGPLAALDNVILTSHMGSYAKEARIKMEIEAVNNLLKGLED